MNSPISIVNRLRAGSPAPGSHGSGGGGRPRRSLARVFAVGLAAALTVLAPAAAFAVTGDWTQFRESQTHQAHNTAELLLSDTNVHSLGLAWTGATGAAVNSSPAISNGVAYVGSSDGKLYAFAVGCATGGGTCTPIWKATTGGVIDSSPAVSGNRVYVGSSDGKLYAFAVGCATAGGSCSPVWTANTGSPIHSSPSVDTGVIYIGSTNGQLYAFAAGCASGGGTCSPIWTATTGAAIESSPAVSAGVIYVGSNDFKLYAFAAGCASGGGTCLPLWTATTGGAVHSSPGVLGGSVYVGSLDHKLYSFDAAGSINCSGSPKVCTPLWTATTGGAIYSSPSLGDGHVWIGSDDGKVYSYHLSCGTSGGNCAALWSGDTGSPVRSSPASAHDVLYVGSSNGNVYAFDADCATDGSACSPAWSSTIGTDIQSSPAVTGSVVYVGSSDGKLYAFHLVADHLVLSPAGATIVSGAKETYTAEAFDSLNVDLGAVTSLTTFSISGVGTCNLNTCGSSVGGDYTVTGTYGAATGTTVLHVSLKGATYTALPPTRLLDTRFGTGLTGTFNSHVARTFPVAGHGGVPANAVAVTGNLTVTAQSQPGYLFMGPDPTNNPTSSTLKVPKAEDRGNAVTVALNSVDGSLAVTYVAASLSAHTQVVFDVTGYFEPDALGASFVALPPTRLLDTRFGTGLSGTFDSHVARHFAVAGFGGVPANAVAVTGNLTVTGQSLPGYLFMGPDPINNPTSSTLNFPKADDRANAVTVKLNSVDGSLAVTYVAASLSAHTQVIFDVTGYFEPDALAATFVALPPTRLLDTRFSTGLSGTFNSHVARSFLVAGHGGVPSNAVAVTGNLTVTGQSLPGYLFMGPDLTNNPTSSTLNFPKGDDRANAVTVKLNSVDGSLAVTYVAASLSAHTQVVFDITGFFVP